MAMTDLNALSIFSGIGGLDLAAEVAGIRTVAMCEKDAFCRAVLKNHWPDVPIFKDIKKLRGEDIVAPINVIHGGPPCQPVSLAGRRRGQSDKRYLWGEVFRLVADIMPRFLVLENVPGVISIAGDDICKELERLGYGVGICSFEAAAVGAPHRRMRVFFVGHSERGGLSRQSRRGTRKEPANGCKDIPDPASGGCREGDEVAEGNDEGSEPGARDRPAFPRPDVPYAAFGNGRGRCENEPERGEKIPSGGRCEDVADSDSTRKLQQSGSVREFREWTCDDSGRKFEPGICGVAHGTSHWMDGYWDREPNIPRTKKGVKNRVNRLKALGNAVVPAQTYFIFRAIAETERSLNHDED